MFSPQPLATPPAMGSSSGNSDKDPFDVSASMASISMLQSSSSSMTNAVVAANSLASPSSLGLAGSVNAATAIVGTPSSMVRAISPPTPAPSPQPGDSKFLPVSNGSPSWGLAQPFEPSTPLSPNIDSDLLEQAHAQGRSPTFDQDHQAEDFAEQFTQSVVAHFPRLTGPERRKLFTSLLPMLVGEDLLHLSQLISPFLRRDFLAELPAEISLHILGFIDDPKDLVRASRVSKTWRALVMDEQTWKAMLQKYRGRGWWHSGEADTIRPPIERIRQSHPEATFSAVTSPPAVPTGRDRRNTLVGQYNWSTGRQSLAGGLNAPARRTSALSPTAQPFQSRRQSVSIQSTLAQYAGPVASTSSSHQPSSSAAGSNGSDAGVNRFLDENQTPLAERRRRTKGKGRVSALEADSIVPQQAGRSSTAIPTINPTAYALQGLGFSARRQSHQVARSPNAPIPQPLPGLLPPPPQDLTSQMSYLSLAAQAGEASSLTSPSARFAPAYNSPVAAIHPALTTSPVAALRSPLPPPQLPRRTSFLSAMPLSAPQPVRYFTRKSQNPFGTAVVSTPSVYPNGFAGYGHADAPNGFSYKTQFKKAYLTESNWLKGPGRLLSRQTSADDGVVTSLGFDSDWIIVGMATNQIHVFDSRTGEYARQLEGHALGVWCLVLVSKGGERLDKDGKKVKVAKTSWDTEEDEKEEGELTEDEETNAECSASADEAYRSPLLSQSMPRCRSASARPPDRERFFQNESPVPDLSQGSAQQMPIQGSASFARTNSSPTMPAKKPVSSLPSLSGSTKGRRPSSFCGLPTGNDRKPSSATSGLFGDSTRFSQQQAAACGTATGWGQRGAIAVTGGCDRDVRVWDVETGECLHVMRGHVSTVRCLKVLDGRPIAISGSRDATLRVWDIEQGIQLRLLAGHQHSVRCIEISGNKVVSGSYDTTCRIWDVDTGECLHVLNGHQHQIYAVAFDGVRVASGSLDSTVRIWSAKTGECLALLQGHTSLVGQLQLTDSVLVTGGSDGRVIVFSLSTFECLHRLCAHDNSVTCLQFNDRFMVTGGNDGKVKLWDRPTGKLIRELADPCEAVWRVTFREDKCVLLCKRNGRTIMDVKTFAPFDDEL